MNCRVIGLDGDDTLWHNETIFARVQERYRALLSQYEVPDAPARFFRLGGIRELPDLVK